MRRREFLGAAAALLGAPLAASAQQAGMPVGAFVSFASPAIHGLDRPSYFPAGRSRIFM